MKAGRTRRWWLALVGKPPVVVRVWGRSEFYEARGWTTAEAWDGVRAAARVFGDRHLPRYSPWDDRYMPVIVPPSMSWDVEDDLP